MTPEHQEAVAAMLYTEMLRRGYTHVAEFHYLHHDPDGKPYDESIGDGRKVISCGRTSGNQNHADSNFLSDWAILAKSRSHDNAGLFRKLLTIIFNCWMTQAHAVSKYPNAELGFGVHSLRAVDSNDIKRTFDQGPTNIPFHLHAAEQLKEVEDCLAFLKRRPVEWILENMPLNDRFHLVHCTHMNACGDFGPGGK